MAPGRSSSASMTMVPTRPSLISSSARVSGTWYTGCGSRGSSGTPPEPGTTPALPSPMRTVRRSVGGAGSGVDGGAVPFASGAEAPSPPWVASSRPSPAVSLPATAPAGPPAPGARLPLASVSVGSLTRPPRQPIGPWRRHRRSRRGGSRCAALCPALAARDRARLPSPPARQRLARPRTPG